MYWAPTSLVFPVPHFRELRPKSLKVPTNVKPPPPRHRQTLVSSPSSVVVSSPQLTACGGIAAGRCTATCRATRARRSSLLPATVRLLVLARYDADANYCSLPPWPLP
ncbi:hypothetical protein Taro_013987 [Colocasia esculenta]|uniref:Uncharacterized protein n=1 Tax=Colocasia esculenta TaxID=4460 RepID=A0A843U7Y5_COLES|nr:hypothetical protein [Colocasia esculenta]